MKVVNSIAELNNYFSDLTNRVAGLKQFVVGNSEKILTVDRSNLTYPVLWLETPSGNWSMQNAPSLNLEVYFVILENTPVDAWQREQYVLSRTLDLTGEVLRILKEDAENNLIDIDISRVNSDPILGYGTDNDYGWRTRVTFQIGVSPCVSDCAPAPACPVGTLARFTWTNTNTGDFDGLTIAENSLPTTEGWTLTWYHAIDGGAEVETADTFPSGLGAGSYILVKLRIVSGDCERWASAFFRSVPDCGQSVPYALDPKHCT